jgi:hypothetical protein
MLTVQGACALRRPVNSARITTAMANMVTLARSIAEREARWDAGRQGRRIVIAKPRRQWRRTVANWLLRGGRLAAAGRDELSAGAQLPVAVAVAALVMT